MKTNPDIMQTGNISSQQMTALIQQVGVEVFWFGHILRWKIILVHFKMITGYFTFNWVTSREELMKISSLHKLFVG